jgi:guanosine-3',5'-bis(diphosphate) 3'-pyrophosphohydrolase
VANLCFETVKVENVTIQDSFNELLNISSNRCSPEGLELIKKAFKLAYDAHDGMYRKSGEPYIVHPIEVAKIVSRDIGLGSNRFRVLCCMMLWKTPIYTRRY